MCEQNIFLDSEYLTNSILQFLHVVISLSILKIPLLKLSFSLIVRLIGKSIPNLLLAFLIAAPLTLYCLPISSYDNFSIHFFHIYFYTYQYFYNKYRYFKKLVNRNEPKNVNFFETPTGFEPASVRLHDYNGRFRRPMCYGANFYSTDGGIRTPIFNSNYAYRVRSSERLHLHFVPHVRFELTWSSV